MNREVIVDFKQALESTNPRLLRFDELRTLQVNPAQSFYQSADIEHQLLRYIPDQHDIGLLGAGSKCINTVADNDVGSVRQFFEKAEPLVGWVGEHQESQMAHGK